MIEPLKPLARRESEGHRATWRRGKSVEPERAQKSLGKQRHGKIPISLVEIRSERPDDNAVTHKRRLSELLPLIPKTF